MSTPTTIKVEHKKKFKRHGLRSRKRKTNAKRTSIGIKSKQQNDINNNNENGEENTIINDNTNTNNKNNNNNNNNIESIASSPPISSSSTINSSLSSSFINPNKKRRNKPRGLGLNSEQRKKQQTKRKNKKLKFQNQKNEKYNDEFGNDEYHRDNIHNIDSAIHIIHNYGEHKLHTHSDNNNMNALKVNINELYNGNGYKLKVNDILEIFDINNENIKVTLKISEIFESAGKWSISINAQIASQQHLKSSMLCNINLVNPLSLELMQIELSFTHQYISRGGCFLIESDLRERVVHIHEKMKNIEKGYEVIVLSCKGKKDNEYVTAGLITKRTKFLFRSRSAWFLYLVQLSKEMWDFSHCGQMHFEKFIDGFLKSVMSKWKKKHCNHVFCIIFFARTFYEESDVEIIKNNRKKGRKIQIFNQNDGDHRYYQDHYMVVVRNWSTNDWSKLSRKLRSAFDRFPILARLFLGYFCTFL
eukprot:385260_1